MNVYAGSVLKSILFISFLSFFVLECATQREPYDVMERTELPHFQGEVENNELFLPVMFHIKKNGSVGYVHLLESSGDREWDEMAVDSMRQWKFQAPEADSNGILVRKNIRVILLTSEVMNLGELVARNEDEARVLYARLNAGISFEQLVRQASGSSSLGKSGRYLEEVNTIDYPAHISKILNELEVGKFTRPVFYNGEYVIFKRYGDRIPTE